MVYGHLLKSLAKKLGNLFLQTKTLQLTRVQLLELLTLHVRTQAIPVEERT